MVELEVVEVQDSVFRIRRRDSCHCYLLRGRHRVALIDPGNAADPALLEHGLRRCGHELHDVDLVLLTHEHFDHSGGLRFVQRYALAAAHRLAAVKLAAADRFVTMDDPAATHRVHVDLWLEEGSRVDLGGLVLEVLHSPGHTSGSSCYYETRSRALFCGDTAFAGGLLPYISESGSVGDQISSLQRLASLRLARLHPGHGRCSSEPAADLQAALGNARALLRDPGRQVQVRGAPDLAAGG